LAWWIKKGPLAVPLVTTGSASDAVPGALGQPNTAVISPGGIDYDGFNGGRWSAGFWLSCDQIIGFDASGFLLETRKAQFSVNSDRSGGPFLAQPVFNDFSQTEDARPVAVPGLRIGGVAFDSTSQLWGVEGNVRSCVYHNDYGRLDVLAGFRYADLEEDLTISAHSTTIPPPMAIVFNNSQFLAAGSSFVSTDQFSTRNRFYGGQIGAQAEFRWGQVFASVLGKLAVGDNAETVTIGGSSVATVPGQGRAISGSGLLAVSSNSGTSEHDLFEVIPELRLRLGYQFNHFVSAYLGYTFLYWSDVVRPGNQIDRVVNPTLVPTSPLLGQLPADPRPAPLFQRADFWAQGLDVGIALNY
jgi:hypothetical protein